MTQRDKWAKRPAVLRYRAFADEVRARGVQVPYFGAIITFGIPMPRSWSSKKKTAMLSAPHQQKPDIDNLLKALLDAVHKDDSGIWQITACKRWAENGFIKIT